MTLVFFAGVGTDTFLFESLSSQSGYSRFVRAKASLQSSRGCKAQGSRHPAPGQFSPINQLSCVVEIPYNDIFDLIPPASTADSIRPSTVRVEGLIECAGNTTIASKICSYTPRTNNT